MQVTMIGLGKLGLPVAEVMAQHYTVLGYDIDQTITSSSVECKSTLYEAVQGSEIIFIAVPTPHDPEYGGEKPTSHLPVKDFNYSYLVQTLQNLKVICRSMETKPMIVNISTVLPGTIRPIVDSLNLGDQFCYNPYLIAMGTVAQDFIHPDIIMLGFSQWPNTQNQTFADKLLDFYNTIQPNPKHITLGTWEEAECIKIFHNTYLSSKISIANMIQDVTNKIGHANPSVISESLKHADRIVSSQYMEPGMGDGGPCHPRDNIAMSWLAHRLGLGYDLFASIMHAREKQSESIADTLCAYNLPITIIGRSFKHGTDLIDGSASELVAYYCLIKGRTIEYDHSADSSPRVYLLAHDYDHSDYRFNANSVVIDMYRHYQTDRNDLTVVWYGCSSR